MAFTDFVVPNVPNPPWRAKWRQASYRGVPFYVEIGGKGSGRRTVLHEFPKRDVPYAEDLGRRAYEFTVVGYLIGPNYTTLRDRLEAALEDAASQGPGVLVLPTRADMTVTCVRYNAVERRTMGGFVEIEMVFIEAGQPSKPTVSTQTVLKAAAQAAGDAAVAALKAILQQLSVTGP